MHVGVICACECDMCMWVCCVICACGCAMSYCICLTISSNTSWYFVGAYYAGGYNSTTNTVFWLNNFDNLARSYGVYGVRVCML